MDVAARDAVVAGIAVAVVVVTFLWAKLSRRAVARRLSSLAARLDYQGGELSTRLSLERALGTLERMTETAVTEQGNARVIRNRLEGALGALGEGVVVCDETGEVVFQNDQATAFMGIRHAEALAQQAVYDLLRVATDGETQIQTLELYGPPRRTLTITACALDDDWKGLGAVAVIEDASERRHLEAVRRDFVANISHEMKTPVGALALLAETLAGEEDPDVVNRLARRLQLEAQRVARTVDDLLDLSRIESEEAPVREPLFVHLIVAQAAERVRSSAEQRSVTITFGEASRRLSVMGDHRQLVSALFNLLENAVKYSEPGTTVDVRSRRDGEWVELDVTDKGIGIPARDIERIFERFYRVDRARGRDTGGTGLGLAIVRHVAGNHGGEVRVVSQEGEGSTFTLRLPASPGAVNVGAVTSAEAG